MSSSDIYDIVTLLANLVSTAISFAAMVLSIVGMWKIFTKAGEEGWKAIIPYYNLYILCKISGAKFVRLLTSMLLFIGSTFIMLATIMGILFAVVYNSTEATIITTIITIVCSLIMFAFLIWFAIEHALLCNSLSKSFGHGAGFAVGLFFIAPVFYMILGFNKDQYIGPKGVKQQL